MNKILKWLANKVICVAFVVLGAISASAAGIREDLKDNNGNVVGYKVTRLGISKDETAVVFTKAGAEIPWTVPADLENVQFLVVAGGGGGGGAANAGLSAGAGGGGGGVVTGVIKSLTEGKTLTLMVGEGGEGGLFTESNEDKAGASISAGKKSYFKLNTIQDVTAYGGGRDLGVHQYGSTGGSRGGNRHDGLQGSGANQGVISNKTDIVSFTLYGNLGGNSDSNTYCFGAGGGGGATGQGGGRKQDNHYDPGNKDLTGGYGGAGLVSDITGEEIVYGSGGGGGTTGSGYGNLDTGKAGVGAGDGAIAYKNNSGSLIVIRSYEGSTTAGNGGNGSPNQGGGGGGGAYGNGGNGGSGIVVFRFKDPIKPGFKVIVR